MYHTTSPPLHHLGVEQVLDCFVVDLEVADLHIVLEHRCRGRRLHRACWSTGFGMLGCGGYDAIEKGVGDAW